MMKNHIKKITISLLAILLVLPIGAQTMLTAFADGRYVVYFDPDGGSVLTDHREVGTDNRLTNLPSPFKDGYQFEGWYREDGRKIDHTTVFTEDTYVKARWKGTRAAIKYTIYFEANGGNVVASSRTTGSDGRLSNLPSANRSGHRFDGWFTEDGSEVFTSTVFDSDTTVYARWTETEPPISNNNQNGNNAANDPVNDPINDPINDPVNNPVNDPINDPANTGNEDTERWIWREAFWLYQLSNGTFLNDEWSYINDEWYRFDDEGHMKTEWFFDEGYWYYFDRDGQMVTGWAWIDGYWYYFDGDGRMQIGWLKLGGKEYFLEDGTGNKPLGAMYRNEKVANAYIVGDDGALVGPVIN